MGELFNKLSEQDVKIIDKWIDSKVSSSHANVDYLLREWDNEKANLYKMFGNQFILHRKIEYNKPMSTLKGDLLEKFNDYNNVCNQFRRMFDRFLWENRVALGYDYDLLQSLLDVDKLINTNYNGNTFYVNSPDGKPVKVQNGCKPMRLISKVCRLYGFDLGVLTAFQNEVSMVLNQKKLTGDLTISIHPLDYMTMSENECDWSSCMNWSEPGCYCRGTVEMMNSPMVVVAYLNAADPMRMPGGYEWSNKKWRELFIVTKRVITGVKGYPYQNEDLVQIVNSWLRDLAVENLGWEFDKKNIAYKHDKDFVYTDDAGVEHSASLCFSTNTMYNDFGSINNHYAILGTGLRSYFIDENYSGAEECMSCGSLDGYYESEGTLICEDCDTTTYCYSCGERISEEDVYWLDGNAYCYSCYNDVARMDVLTEEEHHENNMVEIRFVTMNSDELPENDVNAILDKAKGGIYVERHSWGNIYWNDYFNGEPLTVRVPGYYSWSDRTVYFVTPDMVTSRGWDVLENELGVNREDYGY